MPRARIPTHYTLRFKFRTVLDWQEARTRGVSRKAFTKSRGLPRPTLQNWERKIEKLRRQAQRQPRPDPSLPPVFSRGSRLTLSGSGRIATTAPVEDALCTFIKDERRLEHTVTMDMIVDAASELMPTAMEGRSAEAKLSWCRRFMQRHGLTIRRICHSGGKTRADLEELRLPFVLKVAEIVASHCAFDPRSSLPVLRALFNMDQTSVFWGMGRRTTVEYVGAPTVRSTTNDGEGYRCTMALTIAADGRVLPPHFVYNGTPGGDVEQEVNMLCSEEVATFSVQGSAWFDDRVMLEWIDKSWKPNVVELSVLILDSLAVHKKDEVADALACTGTAVMYVPGGCTGVAQPLDVGVMSPLKQHIRRLNTTRSPGRPRKVSTAVRRRIMFERAMDGLRCISPETVRNCFLKAGPFAPFGPPNNVGGDPSPGSPAADRILFEAVL